MSAQRERILITVKTYPLPSTKYAETVCTAGLALGMGKFIRLYPIRFRELSYDQQFKKWDLIEADIEQKTADARGDTYTPAADSIRPVGHVDTGSTRRPEWAERNRYVLPHASTIEELVERADKREGSLGLVRVEPGAKMTATPDTAEWSEPQRAVLGQMRLFGKDLKPLEKVPWAFRYRFKCCPDCPEHTMTVLDWEVFALYRKQAQRKSPGGAVQDVLHKYNVQYGVERRDLHFFVGTTIDHQSQFSIIGVYYPPRMSGPNVGAAIPLF
jgi:hypothetical protein